MKAVLFDCDGTLADSFGIIVGTMRRTFERAGLLAPDDASVHGIIGLSLETAIHRLTPATPASEMPALAELYRSTFHELRNEAAMREALYPGIEPMLRRLAAAGDLSIGMVTGKSRRGVRFIVEAHGLEGIFQAVRTADDCPSKPHPAMVLECCIELGVSPTDTLVVGDSTFDMAMAVAAGATGLGVLWGAKGAADLVEAGASATVATVADLESWILAGRAQSAGGAPAGMGDLRA